MDDFISPPADRNASTIRVWRSFTLWQWAIYQHVMGGLLRPFIWQEYTPELEQELIALLRKEVPPASECPEQPPRVPVMQGGGEVGRFGMTLEELEDYLMIINMKPSLGYRNGVVHYYDAGCCEYLPIPNLDGETAPPINSEAAAALATGMLNYQQWLDAGEPELPTLPETPHDIFSTTDAKRCAKATALVKTHRILLGVLQTTLEILSVGTTTSMGAILAALASGLASGGVSIAVGASLALGLVILATINAVSLATMYAQVLEWRNDDGMYDSFLCTLVGAVYPSEKIEDIDIGQTMKYFLVENGIDQTHWIHKIYVAWPMQLWKELAGSRYASEECGCEQYLPYGYVPQPPEGSIAFNFKEFAHNTAANGVPAEGTDYSAAIIGGRIGVENNGYPATEYAGVASGYHQERFGAIFEFNEEVEIDQIELTWEYLDGIPQFTPSHAWITFDELAAEWRAGFEWSPTVNQPNTDGTTNATLPIGGELAKHFMISFVTSDGTEAKPVRMTSIRVSGTFGISGFTDLELGEIFTP